MDFMKVKDIGEKIKTNIEKVIVGKDDVIYKLLISLFSSGHVLLEDVPGTGKTMLSKCLAVSMDCEISRVQFTPDLLPSDITGINYYNQRSNEFIFRPGPVFSNVVLADEINRATPRTQSSLLEAMEERQVTIDGVTHKLKKPFFVVATQNPIEIQGTFPLPEAQLDRFFMRIRMGYPTGSDGEEIITRFLDKEPLPDIKPVVKSSDILYAMESFKSVKVIPDIVKYINDIIEKTRSSNESKLGASPRAGIALCRASQTRAALEGRNYITPDDVKFAAVNVLAHRIILDSYIAGMDSKESEDFIKSVLKQVDVPKEMV